MDSPMNRCTSNDPQPNQPACMNVSPERLNAMSPSELEQSMEQALLFMSDGVYDPAVLDAYLNALDQKAPMPAGPDAKTSYDTFSRRVRALPNEISADSALKRRRVRLRSAMRVAVAAALLVGCLFGSAVVAQAAGVDVFGAVARWTEDVFSFGAFPDEAPITTKSSDAAEQENHNAPQSYAEIPAEYQEAQAAFAERGLPFYYMKPPEGFEPCESSFFVFPSNNRVIFDISYRKDEHFIAFSIQQIGDTSTAIYEKDDSEVEPFVYNNVVHYIFHNVTNYTAAWKVNGVECSITTTGSSEELKALIQSIYEE